MATRAAWGALLLSLATQGALGAQDQAPKLRLTPTELDRLNRTGPGAGTSGRSPPPGNRRQVLASVPPARCSAKYWWTTAIAMLPSPTPAAHRLIDPWRTSPAASTPGMLVSSR